MSHETRVQSLLNKHMPFVRPNMYDTVLDVGAYKGDWSNVFSKYFEQVIAYEPNSLALFRWPSQSRRNIQIRKIALWSEPGVRTMYHFEEEGSKKEWDGANSIVWEEHPAFVWQGMSDIQKAKRAWPVVVDTIDNQDIRGHIDLIKLDVEGAEFEVLRGGYQTINHYRPFLVIEIHTKELREQIEPFLADLEYSWEYSHLHPDKYNETMLENQSWIVAYQ